MDDYEFAILGSGPAGLSSAIYAARFRLKTIVIGELPGGLITTTHLIENWPGIISISGLDLAESLKKHAEANDVLSVQGKVTDVKTTKHGFMISLEDGAKYSAKSVLFATGTTRRKLNIPGEKEFTNKGVSYCAVCDGALFKNKIVCIIGGSDSAVKESLFLAEHASKVYIIYRGDKLRAEPINMDRMNANKKIEVITNRDLSEIFGEKSVKGVKFKEGGELAVDGVFVEIGATPNSGLAEQLGVFLNEKKEIIADSNSSTNVPGVFAAGDVTNSHFKQAITGASEGVIAAFSAFDYLDLPSTLKK